MESLDSAFENVCELDLVFNFDEVRLTTLSISGVLLCSCPSIGPSYPRRNHSRRSRPRDERHRDRPCRYVLLRPPPSSITPIPSTAEYFPHTRPHSLTLFLRSPRSRTRPERILRVCEPALPRGRRRGRLSQCRSAVPPRLARWQAHRGWCEVAGEAEPPSAPATPLRWPRECAHTRPEAAYAILGAWVRPRGYAHAR